MELRHSLPASALICFCFVEAGFAASFDCSKASTKIEQTICTDSALSHLDETLDAKYREVLISAAAPEDVRREQRHWISTRNQCSSSACIRQSYLARIANFTKWDNELRALKERLEIPSYSKDLNTDFCVNLRDGIKAWKEVTVLIPFAVSDSAEGLQRYLGKCNPRKFTRSVSIEPRVWREQNLDSMSEEQREAYGMGFTMRKGFRLYRTNIDNDPANKNELILYGANNAHDGAAESDTSANLTDFNVIDTKNCRITTSAQVEDVINSPNAFVGLIRFQNRNYVFDAKYYPKEMLYGINIKQWMHSNINGNNFIGQACHYVAKDR